MRKLNVIIVITLSLFVALFLLQKCASDSIDIAEPIPQIQANPPQLKIEEKQKPIQKTGPLERKMYVEPNGKYMQHVISSDGQEVARYKTKIHYNESYDYEGEVINGEVRFRDANKNYYGIEYYFNGSLHGLRQVFYPDGQLYEEEKYFYGKLSLRKQFYIDGIVRLEETLEDAIKIPNLKDTGVGKVYYRDGVLRYEWSITKSGNGGYIRAYDPKGELMVETYYDRQGRVLKDYKR